MRTLNHFVVTFYIAFASMVTFSLVSLFSGADWAFLNNFTMFDTILLIISVILLAIQLILLAKALTFDTPSRVAVYNYLSAIFQFIFDVTILDVTFVGQQLIGCGIIFTANIMMIYLNIRRFYLNQK